MGFDASFRQRLDVLACPRCGRRLTLIPLIEDPSVIVRLLGRLGLPTDIPEPSRPGHRRCTSSVMHLRLTSLATRSSSTNPPDPACSTRQPARRVPRRLESRLTAARRVDTMPSVEARHPRVGGANPPVGEGVSVKGALVSSIVRTADQGH